MSQYLSLCAHERIRIYENFKRQIAALNTAEDQCEAYRRFLDSNGRKNYWIVVSTWRDRIIFKIELLKEERLADSGWLVEAFENIFGEVTGTEDETEYESMTRRRFKTAGAELLVEIPVGHLTCRRVPTGEVETVEKYRLECVEGASA